MDFKKFISDSRAVIDYANQIGVKIDDENIKKLLDELITRLESVLKYFSDEDIIDVLMECKNRCDRNDNGDKKEHPLDSLYRHLVSTVEPLEKMISSDMLDYLDPEKNKLEPRTTVGTRNIGRPDLTWVMNSLNNVLNSRILPVFSVLRHLHMHNRTLIILGPNGSGKTSFANYLKDAEGNIKVIPASKPIFSIGNVSLMYNATVDSYNSALYSNNHSEELLRRLIIGLCTDHDNKARKYYDNEKAREASVFSIVKDIYDQFFSVKLDDSKFADKEVWAADEKGNLFPFNNMSDGERAAFFYIATVMVAPNNSFIIVDEPENHLNPAVYNKIWDKLIEQRSDCQFIFISHTVEFIRARTDYELVRIKSFRHPDKFEFEFLGDRLEDIDDQFIVDIVGSRKPLLFCEGSRADYDYKIYETLFGDKYTVIPTGNCLNVEKSVEACNMHAITYGIQSSIGVIDSDLKNENEIERLRAKKIYVLKCNEIEMLLVDEVIFKRVLKQVYKPEDTFNLYKEAFFKKFSERKEYIIKRLVKTQIDEKMQTTFIDDKTNRTCDEIKGNLEKIFSSLDVDDMWSESEQYVSRIISDKDYDAALKYCCLEHNEIIGGVCNRFVNEYAIIALGVVKSDIEVSNALAKKYFPQMV